MAASSQRTDRSGKMLAFTWLLTATLLNGVNSEEKSVTMMPLSLPRGDNGGGQVMVVPTMQPEESAAQTMVATATEKADESSPAAPQDPADEGTKEVQTAKPVKKSETPAPNSPRGDGDIPKPVARDDVICVSKKAVEGRNAVNLKLKTPTSCEQSRTKIASVLQELCGEDCKLEIYQEDNTDDILVSGKYVEDDVTGMTNKFNNDNIKDKTDVEEAIPRWGKNSKLVLISILLAGLLLAALLTAGYYFKTHHKNSKGVRLADSFQVDEENQANTLVSVAPLPQEPIDKPIVNGESPPENGTNPTPTTNGHSATQSQVADTEM